MRNIKFISIIIITLFLVFALNIFENKFEKLIDKLYPDNTIISVYVEEEGG
ncbi:hypothetical protein [Hydrogenothermus marinus]|uniref:hypothetical protein n=1 Tax=Hydrogenothermus marinus TaxID=133270 RepID=UPI001474A156|nr:hypothetical protein [Hydrogenothermus marinus]